VLAPRIRRRQLLLGSAHAKLANYRRLCAQLPSGGSDTGLRTVSYRISPRDDRVRGLHSSDLVSAAARLAPYLSLAGFIEDPRFMLGE
jgi:hypothetical protein